MVVDIGEVRKYIKPKADSTLRSMRKDDLIDYIRVEKVASEVADE